MQHKNYELYLPFLPSRINVLRLHCSILLTVSDIPISALFNPLKATYNMSLDKIFASGLQHNLLSTCIFLPQFLQPKTLYGFEVSCCEPHFVQNDYYILNLLLTHCK